MRLGEPSGISRAGQTMLRKQTPGALVSVLTNSIASSRDSSGSARSFSLSAATAAASSSSSVQSSSGGSAGLGPTSRISAREFCSGHIMRDYQASAPRSAGHRRIVRKSPGLVRFRVNRTLIRHGRMTEADPTRSFGTIHFRVSLQNLPRPTSSGFVGVNPNSKIPALMDYSERTPQRVFESGAILLYLADKFGAFLPKDRGKRTEALNWLFWQMGSTPYVGGGFGHFYAYAPAKSNSASDRFTMEVKRLRDVLDQHLVDDRFIAGDEYTIADMAIWPWYGNGMLNGASYNDPREFLQTHEYKNLTRWTKEIGERPAVKRGRMVNRASGQPEEQLRERHDASDFETETQDKIDARG